MTLTTQNHVLYRFYAADGALLYVGITADPVSRWRSHRGEKPWWHEVTNITLEVHPDRETVLTAETAAIQNESPRYNIVHNRGGVRMPVEPPTPDWLEEPWLAKLGTHAETMPDDCHDRCVPNGRQALYFPYKWRPDGRAWYQCAAGHVWICWWGYEGLTGDAPEYRANPVEVYS